ncbi:MAG: sulfite exporter TauE/SafE family protein [Tuberibacillus sp.]
MGTGIILLLIGFVAGAYGIMVGAGGGFIFVPALLILLHLSPEVASGTGLVVVFINSISGLYGYIRQKRIDYKMGLLLALGATPGTILGIWLTKIASAQSFNLIFAIMLVALGIFLILKKSPHEKASSNESKNEIAMAMDKRVSPDMVKSKQMAVLLVLVGVLLGIVSSFFGIGGGWLLVPILIYLFRVHPHYATAVSIFSLCLYSTIGVVIHIFQGNIDWAAAIWGSVGIFFGAQLGVFISNRISGKRIIQMLAVILIAVGLKLIL